MSVTKIKDEATTGLMLQLSLQLVLYVWILTFDNKQSRVIVFVDELLEQLVSWVCWLLYVPNTGLSSFDDKTWALAMLSHVSRSFTTGSTWTYLEQRDSRAFMGKDYTSSHKVCNVRDWWEQLDRFNPSTSHFGEYIGIGGS